MPSDALYRILVPNAPLHRRTEADEPRGVEFGARASAVREVKPGLDPEPVSSYAGSIERILFCFPCWVVGEPELVAGYSPCSTRSARGRGFIVAHNESIRPVIEGWFADAGHALEHVEFVPLPDFVTLTDWAEDAYVSLKDDADGASYLMEPWAFGRGGDALIADAVEEYTAIRASGAPLSSREGTASSESDFWLLGTDYFADTVDLLTEPALPCRFPPERAGGFRPTLFAKYVDAGRKLILVGTQRPIPLREFVGTREGDDFYLDLAAEGAGTFQPIFHIDMFVTLVGETPAARSRCSSAAPRSPTSCSAPRRLCARERLRRHRRGPGGRGIRCPAQPAGAPADDRRFTPARRTTVAIHDAGGGKLSRRRSTSSRRQAPTRRRRSRRELAPRHVEQLPCREQRERRQARLPTDVRPRRMRTSR